MENITNNEKLEKSKKDLKILQEKNTNLENVIKNKQS